MNHPNREEWMSYLYEELDANAKADLQAHLHVCPDCQSNVLAWRGTMNSLNDWSLSVRRSKSGWVLPALKWGIAAMLVLSLGFGFGRSSTSTVADIKTLRAELELSIKSSLEPVIREKLREEFKEDQNVLLNTASIEAQRELATFIEAYKAAREEDRQSVLAALQQMDQRHRTDYAYLRKDLETVAVSAENKIDSTQEQLGQLISFAQPASNANP